MKHCVVEVSPARALKPSSDEIVLTASVDDGPTKLPVFYNRFIAVKIAP